MKRDELLNSNQKRQKTTAKSKQNPSFQVERAQDHHFWRPKGTQVSEGHSAITTADLRHDEACSENDSRLDQSILSHTFSVSQEGLLFKFRVSSGRWPLFQFWGGVTSCYRTTWPRPTAADYVMQHAVRCSPIFFSKNHRNCKRWPHRHNENTFETTPWILFTYNRMPERDVFPRNYELFCTKRGILETFPFPPVQGTKVDTEKWNSMAATSKKVP